MFWKTFLDLCVKKGVAPTTAGVEMGLTGPTVGRWKNGSIPNDTTLIKISKYFGVSVDYLLGKEPEKAPETEKATPSVMNDSVYELVSYLEELRSNPEMRMLFSLMKGATKEDVQKAVEIIKILRGTGDG